MDIIQKGREKWYSKLFRILNSAICFSIAYIVVTYSSWFVMGLVGKLFKFNSFVYYYGIKYMLNGQEWTTLKVTAIYSVAPFFALFFGILSFYLFDKLKKIRILLNLFFLWGFVIGTSVFCAQGIIMSLGIGEYLSPFYQNFTVVMAWWHIPAPVVYLLTIPFMILLAYFATNYARPFLLFAYSYSKVMSESKRKRYFIETAFVPFIIGTLIVTGVTYPMNIFVHAVHIFAIGAALVISWLALTYRDVQRDDILRYSSLQDLSAVFLAILFMLVLAVVVGWKGVNL